MGKNKKKQRAAMLVCRLPPQSCLDRPKQAWAPATASHAAYANSPIICHTPTPIASTRNHVRSRLFVGPAIARVAPLLVLFGA